MEKIGNFFLMFIEATPTGFFILIFSGISLLIFMIWHKAKMKKKRSDLLKDKSFPRLNSSS
jgi:hypothetical protein